ncbi:unnamed protein product [Gulo gulo]|uniref:Uncharacterized protein n=1 Tax=Gulo gulo TaxID=48420 RepID=A0A9X9LME8_GULGU|nr:unnamed protein product [Gulo gulo]
MHKENKLNPDSMKTNTLPSDPSRPRCTALFSRLQCQSGDLPENLRFPLGINPPKPLLGLSLRRVKKLG